MRQAETAATVYREDIKPTLTDRQQFVRHELAEFVVNRHYGPTSLELLRFMHHRYPDRYFDVNSVRPRLHELAAMEPPQVRHGVKRRCDVSGKTVLTWVLATGKPAPAQTGLF